ncbi:MAG TPA: alpha/beta hydrolase [Acidobacteriota bacterium]|nr:alpha/beta hydrolase [Acidobacteriota bacterium]
MKFLAILAISVALFSAGCAATAGMIAGYGPIENSWKNEYAKKDVQLSTGVDMKYHDVGPKEGKPIIFIHGPGSSSRDWYSVGPELLDSYRVIAMDLRGHGQSSIPECCFTLDDYERDVIALMDALKINDAIIVGHSMGGFIAERIAIDFPTRVQKLILVSSSDKGIDNDKYDRLYGTAQTQKGLSDPAVLKKWNDTITVLPIPDVMRTKSDNERAATPPTVWKGDLKSILSEDNSGKLSAIKAPTLILWGEQDQVFVKEDQDRLRAEIQGAEFKSYPTAGHTVQWELPAEVAKDIRTFIGS